ncbi:hypothetical protein [Helicobacter sp. T3_23-1059]
MSQKQNIQTQIKTLLLTSLYNNSGDLGLEICDNCGCSSSADIRKIADWLAECIYHFLVLKGMIKDKS